MDVSERDVDLQFFEHALGHVAAWNLEDLKIHPLVERHACHRVRAIAFATWCWTTLRKSQFSQRPIAIGLI